MVSVLCSIGLNAYNLRAYYTKPNIIMVLRTHTAEDETNRLCIITEFSVEVRRIVSNIICKLRRRRRWWFVNLFRVKAMNECAVIDIASIESYNYKI